MILAIVLGIAVPGVLGIIHHAEKNAFKQSAGMLLETGRIYYGQRKMDRNSIKDQESFYFPETKELEYSGEKPQDGYLTIYEDGSQYIEITNGTYCAYGDQASDIKVKDGLCQDQTPGVLAGTGTEKDPYKIESIEDLVQFGKIVDGGNTYENKYVTLEKSLDFKNEKNYVNSKRTDYGDINENGVVEPLLTELTTDQGFNPIGYYSGTVEERKVFSGTFDGKNKSIFNIFMDSADGYGTSLFVFNYGMIKNVMVQGFIRGQGAAGIAYRTGTTTVPGYIDNCHFRGNVIGSNNSNSAGGIVGVLSYGSVTNCSMIGTVEGGLLANGGIAMRIGNASSSQSVAPTSVRIKNCYFRGTIKSDGMAGGIVAQNFGLNENVYVDGTIQGGNETGGILGEDFKNVTSAQNYTSISQAYTLGTITGNNYVGGLVGYENASLKNVLNASDVSGTIVGDIIGYKGNNGSTFVNVYSKEGQQVLGSTVLTLGTVVSLPTLSPSSWWKNTLGFDNNWKIEDGYYPLLYKVDENGNPTTELLPGQKKIPIR